VHGDVAHIRAGKIYDKFLADFSAKARRIKLGPADNFETQMGPLISEAQRKKVIAYVDKAKAEGASLLCGGSVPDGAEFEKRVFF